MRLALVTVLVGAASIACSTAEAPADPAPGADLGLSGSDTADGGAPGTTSEAPPRYDDGKKNGNETDVDCGGDPAHPCAVRLRCTVDADCASALCGTVGDHQECVVARSCTGGSGAYFDCGAARDESCCGSHEVPGGTFNRFNNATYPAKVSAYRLDDFEITAGRFRGYVAATGGDLRGHAPAEGAGAHPKIPGSGWRSEWNAFLPGSLAEVEAMFENCAAGGTVTDYGARTYWTPALDAQVRQLVGDPATLAANSKDSLDRKPLNCASWHVLEAFCVWDGGRLPTLAEWTFAAQGGDEQRSFPWGNTLAPEQLATWNDAPQYYAPIPLFEPGKELAAARLWDPSWGPNKWPTPYLHTWGTPYRVNGDNAAHIAEVGSFPRGKGRWGHSDLAGNLHELVLDQSDRGLPKTCDDCASVDYTPMDVLDPSVVAAGWDPEWYRGGTRVLLGGSWENSSHMNLSYTDYFIREALKYPIRRTYAEAGARCARPVSR